MVLSSLTRLVVKGSAAALCCLGVLTIVPSVHAQTGACCRAASPGTLACSVLTQAQCHDIQGTWLGAGTVCTNNSCPTTTPPTGACCVATAGAIHCTITTQAACQGQWKGAGTVCSGTICTPPATGACCAQSPNGVSCSITTEAACASAQGQWRGAGTTCTSTTCAVTQPSGACCLPPSPLALAPCQFIPQAQCTQMNGSWRGAGVACGMDTCFGACCLTASTAPFVPCLVGSVSQCAATAGGVFKGFGTTCGNTTPSEICNPPATGACCVTATGTTGGCQIKTQAQCNALHGHWLGAGTTCANDTCVPRGACCSQGFAGPLCSINTAAGCANSPGGIYLGNNTVCTATSCPSPAPTGACCLSVISPTAGGCTITTQAACHGQWKGPNTTCGADTCAPRGACCYNSSTSTATVCAILTHAQCTARNGSFRGNGSSCVPFPCPQPVRGACCVSAAGTNGVVCIFITQAECTARHGHYRGDNVACTNTTCPQPTPTGACCIAAAVTPFVCQVLTQAACTTANGTYRGHGTNCSGDICVPRGACCNPSLSTNVSNCMITTQAVCTRLGGTWTSGGVCAATTCPPPPARGACCINNPNGTFCSILSQAQCTHRNGAYQGNASACTPTTCPRPCVCDWNQSGSITPADLTAFLTDFLAGNGDVDGDGDTDVADLNAFLSCYQNPPPSCFAPAPAPLLDDLDVQITPVLVDPIADAPVQPRPTPVSTDP